ncbi:MAG: hypothetical protein ABEN55_16190, partial [Bradymonadaceae bacterium]
MRTNKLFHLGCLVVAATVVGCTNSDASRGDDWRLDGASAPDSTAVDSRGNDIPPTDAGRDDPEQDAQCPIADTYRPPNGEHVYRVVYDNSNNAYICPDEIKPDADGDQVRKFVGFCLPADTQNR